VVAEGLTPYLADSRDAWELSDGGNYVRAKPKSRAQGSPAQEELLARLADKTKLDS